MSPRTKPARATDDGGLRVAAEFDNICREKADRYSLAINRGDALEPIVVFQHNIWLLR